MPTLSFDVVTTVYPCLCSVKVVLVCQVPCVDQYMRRIRWTVSAGDPYGIQGSRVSQVVDTL
jgi:hypothetical protein